MLVEKLQRLGIFGRFCRLGFVFLCSWYLKTTTLKWMNGTGDFPRISYVKNWFIIQLILIANHFFQWMAMRFQVKVEQQRSQHLKGLTHFWCDFPSNFQMEYNLSEVLSFRNAFECKQNMRCVGVMLWWHLLVLAMAKRWWSSCLRGARHLDMVARD